MKDASHYVITTLMAGSHDFPWTELPEAFPTSFNDFYYSTGSGKIHIQKGVIDTYLDGVGTKSIIEQNLPPVFDPIDDQNAEAGTPLSFTIQARDPNNDTIFFTHPLSSELPTGATFIDNHNGTGTFMWSRPYGGGPYTITFEASDGFANTVNNIFITVSCAITATANISGTITPSGTITADSGANISFVITPNTGYSVQSVLVDGVSQGAITSYTFTNVTAAHTITATFKINTYVLTATQTTGGTITPGVVTVKYGAGSIRFTITPSTGYTISDVKVDGASVGAVKSYIFYNVVAAHTITATFITVPGAPTISTATGGNAKATVTFTAPASNGGSPITSYTTVSSPGNFACTTKTSPSTVTGLANGTTYTFTVKATNAVGIGTPSAASNSVTPAPTVPEAPTNVTATAGNAQATVAFFLAPSATGGSPITSYIATSTPGSRTVRSTISPITVAGLTNGTAYTFTVKATNAIGTGPASGASNSVTPVAK